jgi:protein TonB
MRARDSVLPDLAFVLIALIAHAAIALTLWRAPGAHHHQATIVELATPSPRASLTPPEPPPLPPPPRRRMSSPKKSAPPAHNATAREPPTPAAAPVFGVTAESSVDDGAFAVATGNTTMIDPQASGHGPATALPPGPPPVKTPASQVVKRLPEIDAEACGRSIVYPEEAEQAGVEGDVKLRVALDERGRVERVDILSGPGHGLNELAALALSRHCKFTPAIASDGKAVPYVIAVYIFHFEVPR